jgi:hypothetical protein
MKGKYFYIKERDNPQLKSAYYTALGNLTVKEAKKAEFSSYGYNTIIKFDTKEAYLTECEKLGIQAKI